MRRRAGVLVALLVTLSGALALTARGSAPRPVSVPPPSAFVPITVAPSQTEVPSVDTRPIVDPLRPAFGGASPSPHRTARARIPPSAARVVPIPRPTRRPSSRSVSSPPPNLDHSVAGIATWFCVPGVSACTAGYPASGMYAAAGPGLRIGHWQGRSVLVCGNGHCITVRLIDWCQCGNGAHLIDLYGAAFRRLAPTSAGIVHVTVRW